MLKSGCDVAQLPSWKNHRMPEALDDHMDTVSIESSKVEHPSSVSTKLRTNTVSNPILNI